MKQGLKYRAPNEVWTHCSVKMVNLISLLRLPHADAPKSCTELIENEKPFWAGQNGYFFRGGGGLSGFSKTYCQRKKTPQKFFRFCFSKLWHMSAFLTKLQRPCKNFDILFYFLCCLQLLYRNSIEICEKNRGVFMIHLYFWHSRNFVQFSCRNSRYIKQEPLKFFAHVNNILDLFKELAFISVFLPLEILLYFIY